MIRHGAPRWLATLVVVIGVFAIIIGLVAAAIIGIARFASILPQYADEMQNQLASLKSCWPGSASPRLTSRKCSAASISPASSASRPRSDQPARRADLPVLHHHPADLPGRRRLRLRQPDDRHRPGREPVLTALGTFAAGTRNYFGVATIFGAIVAVLDGARCSSLASPVPVSGRCWRLSQLRPNIGSSSACAAGLDRLLTAGSARCSSSSPSIAS